MTVIVPQNVNCNKGLIATQAKPVCIILHSIKEITSDERKTLNDPSVHSCNIPQSCAIYLCTTREETGKGRCIIGGESSGIRISSENTRKK